MNEFEFINNIKKKYGLANVGDDCAVLPGANGEDLLITADLLIEGVDFETSWATGEQIGERSLAVSLSDIAAMGGEPRWAMVSLGVPERLWQEGFPDAFMAGWQRLAASFGCELVGGDISRSPGPLCIDSVVLGAAGKGSAIRRSGARSGDAIYVSGPLGSSAAGLQLLKSGRGGSRYPDLIQRHLLPTPQVTLGKQLRELGIATSMIDISDGLSTDLSHICKASGVGAVIVADHLPFEGSAMEVAGTVEQMLDMMLNGGEDFELLFTADPDAMKNAKIEGLFRVGEITAEVGVIELERNGTRQLLPPNGFSHF